MITLGLLLGIIGCYFLTRAFLHKKYKDIINEVIGGRWLGNLHLARSLIAQKWDTIFGFILVGLGFFVQILGIFLDLPVSMWIILAISVLSFLLFHLLGKDSKEKEGVMFVIDCIFEEIQDKKTSWHLVKNKEAIGAVFWNYVRAKPETDKKFLQEVADLMLIKYKGSENFNNLKDKIKQKLRKYKYITKLE